MANNPNKPAENDKLVYLVEYDTYYSAIKSPVVHKALSERSWYKLREASDDYVLRMAEILRKEGFSGKDITVKLTFEKK